MKAMTRIQIGAGHRRYRGARLAGLTQAPRQVIEITEEAFQHLLHATGMTSPAIKSDDLEQRRREDKRSWTASLNRDSRQQERRRYFRASLRTVNAANAARNRHGRPIDQHFTLARAERRNLARAYAAKDWRERRTA